LPRNWGGRSEGLTGDGVKAAPDDLRQRYRRDTPLRVFYQVWDKPLYTVGGGQIISDALEVCGHAMCSPT
jgi:vitamin B12 transport system substrate-binding protein